MSRNCEAYELLISQAIDGELTPEEERSLREHLRVCADCRALAGTFRGLSLSLREDAAEPPTALLDGVMDRIAPDSRPDDSPAPRIVKPSRRSWRRFAVAAAVFVVVAGGAYAAARGARSASDARAPESMEVRMDTAYGAVEEAAEAPMAPLPEAAPEPDVSNGTMTQAAAAEPTEAEAPADRMTPAEDAGAGLTAEQAASLFTLDTPASVPAGREADFEALNRNIGTAPAGDTIIVAYVEHHGIIYEYSTDGEHLIWRDAAEGLPSLSPGTVEDLLDILA